MLTRKQIPPYQQVEGVLDFHDYVDRYDAEIRYVDDALAVLIDELRRKNLWEDSLVIFTADHGESLGEHKIFFKHHFNVYEETVRVPLAIRLPGPAERESTTRPVRIPDLCSPMDLPPTILAYLDVPYDGPFDGRNLIPLMTGSRAPDRALLLEFPAIATSYMSLPDIYAVRTATHKLIRILDSETGQPAQQAVFDLGADPLEQRAMPLDGRLPIHRGLADRLDAMIAQVRGYKLPFVLTEYEMPMRERPGFVEQRRQDDRRIIKTLAEDQIERLRALGYVS